jgi:hypothetical protein
MSQDYDDEYDTHEDEGGREPFSDERAAGANRWMLPGVFMIITGVVNLVCGVGGVLIGVQFTQLPEADLQRLYDDQPPENRKQLQDAGIGTKELRQIYVYGFGGGGVLWLLCALLTAVGGACMCAGKARGLAIFSALVTILPCVTSPCCLLGMPVGIWALVALMQKRW